MISLLRRYEIFARHRLVYTPKSSFCVSQSENLRQFVLPHRGGGAAPAGASVGGIPFPVHPARCRLRLVVRVALSAARLLEHERTGKGMGLKSRGVSRAGIGGKSRLGA
jgi:hypothetical protein